MPWIDRLSLRTQVLGTVIAAAIIAMAAFVWPPAHAVIVAATRGELIALAVAVAVGVAIGWWANGMRQESIAKDLRPPSVYRSGPATPARKLLEAEITILTEMASKSPGEPSAASEFTSVTREMEQKVLHYLESLEADDLIYQKLIRSPRRFYLTAKGRAFLAREGLL